MEFIGVARHRGSEEVFKALFRYLLAGSANSLCCWPHSLLSQTASLHVGRKTAMEIMIREEEAHVLSRCPPFKSHGTTWPFVGHVPLPWTRSQYDLWAKSSLPPAFGQCVQHGVVIFKRLGEKAQKKDHIF